jgi:hypothetical protein
MKGKVNGTAAIQHKINGPKTNDLTTNLVAFKGIRQIIKLASVYLV